VEDEFDAARRWRLNPQVAVRPERFGALLYHFGTRRLSFLKDRALVQVVRCLDEHDTARAACLAVGVEPAHLDQYERALAQLATAEMIIDGGDDG
jgi:putative mycofactocin binding protein MftB